MAEWITAIAALVAALATVGYFIATIYIFRETKKSADGLGDSITVSLDKHHQRALVIDGFGKKTKLQLMFEETRNPN
jgi:hypothetical protein